MLSSIKEFFQDRVQTDTSEMTEEQRRLACAALLIEVAIIDNEFDGSEMAALKSILSTEFNIPQESVNDLVTMAHNECTQATSMYQFTHLINQQCSFEEKFQLITGMWRIAFADGDLDKYEEYVIRKVADLIHLGHGEFIRAKHAARTETAR